MIGDWERIAKRQDAMKYLAHYVAMLDGKHYAVDKKYWRIAERMLDNVPEDPEEELRRLFQEDESMGRKIDKEHEVITIYNDPNEKHTSGTITHTYVEDKEDDK